MDDSTDEYRSSYGNSECERIKTNTIKFTPLHIFMDKNFIAGRKCTLLRRLLRLRLTTYPNELIGGIYSLIEKGCFGNWSLVFGVFAHMEQCNDLLEWPSNNSFPMSIATFIELALELAIIFLTTFTLSFKQ